MNEIREYKDTINLVLLRMNNQLDISILLLLYTSIISYNSLKVVIILSKDFCTIQIS